MLQKTRNTILILSGVTLLLLICINIYKKDGSGLVYKPPYSSDGLGVMPIITNIDIPVQSETQKTTIQKAFNNFLIKYVQSPSPEYYVNKQSIQYSISDQNGVSATSFTVSNKNNVYALAVKSLEDAWVTVTVSGKNNETYSETNDLRPTPSYNSEPTITPGQYTPSPTND